MCHSRHGRRHSCRGPQTSPSLSQKQLMPGLGHVTRRRAGWRGEGRWRAARVHLTTSKRRQLQIHSPTACSRLEMMWRVVSPASSPMHSPRLTRDRDQGSELKLLLSATLHLPISPSLYFDLPYLISGAHCFHFLRRSIVFNICCSEH